MRRTKHTQSTPIIAIIMGITLTANTWLVTRSDFSKFWLKFLGSELRIERAVSQALEEKQLFPSTRQREECQASLPGETSKEVVPNSVCRKLTHLPERN